MSLDEYALSVLGPATDRAGFANRSFIALGGDSLRAMRLTALAQEQLGLRLSVAELLSSTPLATVLAGATANGPTPDGPTPQGNATTAGDAQPTATLTPTQRGMWLIENVLGGSTYNLVFTSHVDSGTLDREVFARAAQAATDRHATLRTLLREQDGEVKPVVLDRVTPDILDIAHDGPDFEGFVRATAAEHGRIPFDLTAAPPLRYLFVTGADRQAVVLVAHHVLLDGWAVGLLLDELFTNYRALKAGEPVKTTPAPTTEALLRRHEQDRASGEWDRLAEFWLKHLDGVPTVLEVPTDAPRPTVQDPAGDRIPLDLDAELTTLAETRAHDLGITTFALLLASYGLALSRWTGVDRLLVGVSLYGRDTAELADLIAVAGNLVPVLVEVDDDAPAADYLRAVQDSLARSIEAGALPFDELVTRLGVERGLSAHPLVQVSFGMHDQLVPQRIEAGDVVLRVEEGHGGGAQFDLSLLFGRSRPTLGAQLEFATALWDTADARAFLDDYTTAVRELATATGRVEDLRCLSAERRAVLDAVNQTRREFPATTADGLFRAAAQRTPDAVAVREGDLELTYAQLAGAAAEQARRLRELGVGRGDRVLVALDRSIAEVVGVLGIAWAGAAYVGVDLAQPEAQVRHILAKAAPKAVLATKDVSHLGVPVCATWEPSWEASDAEPTGTGPDDLAYIAFTSGSTGLPKGVAVPHRAVVRLVHEPDFVHFGPEDRVLRLSPLAFDASTLELWGPLAGGAALEVHPAGLPSPSELSGFLLERGVTVAWLTAGLFRLVEEFAPAGLGGLRQLVTGGDVVPHAHVARVLERHPGIVVTNGYGPTENTTFTTTHSVTSPADVDGPLPIGTPLPGTRVHVLDRRHRVVPPGAVGELYAAGEGLAHGYVDDEAESARGFGHFSPDVPDRLYRTGDLVRVDRAGRLRFLGRRDDQVKLRGFRIELSAIADVLTTDPRVRDAAVVVTDGDSADKRLLAAIVPAGPVGTDELRDLVADRLPAYMVPTLWAVVDRLPVTGNGKVDRRALAAVAAPAGQRVAAPAANPLGTAPSLFARVLDKPVELTGETDFFTVGGNSMGAVKLLRLIRDELGVSVRLRDFLLAPTPAGLNKLIEAAKS
ncbi:amino acid adenylation domain-containing protein [Saccharothrix sp. NPDC042600]|uniref:non-ribosomal peptide synthetase n=1 Tax=Saccharothrix TaxID=2071 RepID=UPI0033DCEDB1|nr:hypothetical protein GCM10017745_56460 [Saccharothrix mutabilis subsp. capreolus]